MQIKIPSKNSLVKIYGKDKDKIKLQTKRYQTISKKFQQHFPGAKNPKWFSASGRIEIGGNHTDHNNGRVLTAAINLDSVALTEKTEDKIITVYSEGFDNPFIVNLKDLSKKTKEKGTTTALSRGIAARFDKLNYKIGGFNACIQSDVLVGSGLSSSASIEVLIGTILNSFYNKNKINPERIAQIGQYAENIYFEKPCGLMDQMTIAVGGIVAIDFKNTHSPIVEKINFDFSGKNYNIIIVNTGGNHADLTDDYASIPNEMKNAAIFFGKKVCREIDFDNIKNNLIKLRDKIGDRAVLRAMHFIKENERVLEQVKFLKKNDFGKFLELVNNSGNSSFRWLQNCYTNKNPHEQGISLALAFTHHYLDKIWQGATRVHGGGFAGTILTLLPKKYSPEYIKLMQSIFDKKCTYVLNIRQIGACQIK